MATDLNNLALLLKATNRLSEAEPLMRRVIEIFWDFQRKTRHPQPHLYTAIQNYLQLLQAMKYTSEQVAKKMEELDLVEEGDLS